MKRYYSAALKALLAATLICLLTQTSRAGTILKLNLGGDSSFDIDFDGTILSTVDDGDAGTTGQQNTAVDFLDFLAPIPDISTAIASFTLDGLTTSGLAVDLGGVVIQGFAGGMLELYDDLDSLLLSATLNTSTLTGTIGPPASGALFTTSFALVTGGSLAPQIEPNSVSLSLSLTNVNGGAAFALTGSGGNLLAPFSADVTANIAANQSIPEPTTALLALMGFGLVVSLRKRA
jgi:hypothetical protein